MYILKPLNKKLIDKAFKKKKLKLSDPSAVMMGILAELYDKALGVENICEFNKQHAPIVHRKTWTYIVEKIKNFAKDKENGYVSMMLGQFVLHGFGVASKSEVIIEFQIRYYKDID